MIMPLLESYTLYPYNIYHIPNFYSSDEELGLRNPAFVISAALTHTAQFVELLAFYLDVNLPKKLSYRLVRTSMTSLASFQVMRYYSFRISYFLSGHVLLGLFRNRNSWNKPTNCSFSGYSDSRVAVKPS